MKTIANYDKVKSSQCQSSKRDGKELQNKVLQLPIRLISCNGKIPKPTMKKESLVGVSNRSYHRLQGTLGHIYPGKFSTPSPNDQLCASFCSSFPILPNYDQLLERKQSLSGRAVPAGSAWGLWGDDDQIGTLNNITPEIVAQSAKLIRKGMVFAMNWQLELPNPPLFGRSSLEHVLEHKHAIIHDDIYNNFNTQSSSQWDGLTHFGHPEGWYNWTTKKDITGLPGTRLGIENLARRGIAGRIVLVDFERWKSQQSSGSKYCPNALYRITLDEFLDCVKSYGIIFKTGDILLIRVGWIKWYMSASLTERKKCKAWAGPNASKKWKEFIWNNHFSAVASDCPSFEAYPFMDFPNPDKTLHPHLIGLMGMPIGEMFDTEAFAADCAKDQVYEGFFTSAPLNKLGGVASPPNAIVIK